jgi:hypothetical protein
MSNELFAAALGVETPWYVKDVKFDAGKRLLTVAIDFKKGLDNISHSWPRARQMVSCVAMMGAPSSDGPSSRSTVTRHSIFTTTTILLTLLITQ